MSTSPGELVLLSVGDGGAAACDPDGAACALPTVTRP